MRLGGSGGRAIRVGLPILLGLAVGAIFASRHSRPQPESPAPAQNQNAAALVPGTAANAIVTSRVAPSEAKPAAPPSAELPVLLDDSDAPDNPTLRRVRAEVMADPHSTPPSVLAFADRVSVFMQAALATHDTALRAAPQLQKCANASADRLAESARVLCLINLHTLAEKNPDLENDYRSTLESVDPRVAFLARATSQLGAPSQRQARPAQQDR